MGKRLWLFVLSLSAVLIGCASSASGSDAMESEMAMAVCETAQPAFTQAADAPLVAEEEGRAQPGIYTYTGSKDGLQTDGLTYFTFSQNTVTHTDEGGVPLLLESLTQTTFHSQCSIQTQWVNEVLADIQKSDLNYGNELLEYAQQNKTEQTDTFYCHSYYTSRGVARHDDHVISLLTQSSVYSGGAHPNMTQTALNLDMKELKALNLEDVIKPEGCAVLYDLLLMKVDEKFSAIGESGLFENYRSIIADSVTYGKMTPYWYFNDQGLVIFFNQYTLAPFAAGIVKVELDYDLLGNILEESYYPEEIKGWIADISVTKERNSQQNIYDVNLGEGETVYIALTGTATHIQLSEVSFAEQTAVASTMLLSVNRLNDQTILAFTAEPDPEKTYAVSYYDVTGGPKILYFQGDQILTDLKSG